MHPRRSLPSLVLALALPALLAACERAPQPSASESASRAAASGAPPGAVVSTATGWWRQAGPVLLVAWPSTAESAVITPDAQGIVDAGIDVADTTAFARSDFTLFDRSGARHPARFGGWVDVTEYEGCSPWPVAHLVDSVGATPAWTVGFARGDIVPVPLDSLTATSRADSTTIVIEAARLASVVRRPVEPSFRGLPFSVTEAHRFEAAPGVQAIAAIVVRKVNQEDSPREERTFLIAERDSGQTTGPFRVAYDERMTGTEETVESPEVLAALRFAPAAPVTLVLARDYGSTRGFSLLERQSAQRWRVRWTSARMRC